MDVLLTCGIGDFIALESYLTRAEREAVEVIHWASRARAALMALIPFVFRNVKRHVVERDTWGAAFTKTFCISSAKELPGLAKGVRDWSVGVIVNDYRRKQRHYDQSSVIANRLCDVSRLGLPEKYFVVHPYSENARTPVRDLTRDEWLLAYKRLNQRSIPIVIVNTGGERLESLPDVIDLTNRLTLLEAIEVTKGAAGFIGAASLFSVVASKTLPADRLFIKGSKDLKMNYATFYYAPLRGNAFVDPKLASILPYG
jgi:hypothetical protein